MSGEGDAGGPGQGDRLARSLRHYQDKLLQVTQKNRSVLLRRVSKKHSFDLMQAESLKKGTAARVLSKAVKNIGAAINDKADPGESHNILPDSLSGDDADVARAHLLTLYRNMEQVEEETGQQVGYLGFPFLQGRPAPGFYVRGPLVLFPISLARKSKSGGSGWILGLEDKRPILNGALVAALRKKGGHQLARDYEERFEDLLEDAAKRRDDPVGHFLGRLSEWVWGALGIDAKVGPQGAAVGKLSKDDTDGAEPGPLRIECNAVVGSFPQADNEIYKDYGALAEMEGELGSGMVGELLDAAADDEEGGDVGDAGASEADDVDIDGTPDGEMNAVLESDSSQDQVILGSKRSDMIVVRGPPGTGKSQVIVNLVADALAAGQRVLVVCQKRAALEVVRQRLGKVGLDRYAVFLGKELDDRAKMYTQLSGIIDSAPPESSDPRESLADISGRIDECVGYLAGLGAALKKEHFGGATAHALYTRADPGYRPSLDMAAALPGLTWDALGQIARRVAEAEGSYKRFEDPSHPWHGRRSFAELGIRDRSDLDSELGRVAELAPGCTLARGPEEQRELLSQFEAYAGSGGLLGGMKKRGPAKAIAAILGADGVDDAFVSSRMEGVRRGAELWDGLAPLLGRLGDGAAERLRAAASDPAALGRRLSDMRVALAEFDAMQELDKKKAEWDTGMLGLLARARDAFGPGADWAECIRQEAYAHWLHAIENESPVLKGDPASRYAARRDDLARLMEQKRAAVVEKIRHDIEGVIRPAEMYGRGRTAGQKRWRDFAAELKKKRRSKPVRRMFEEYGEEMFRVAPCWLASPESVSRVFPLRRGLFDLVIVDEASQLAVERSIPFLYRAGRAVVAGDEKQLPPFDLFRVSDSDEDADEDIADERSLLDLAARKYETYVLQWHYRSRYQDLIDFSNHAFYEGMLRVAPNASTDPSHPPIRWIECTGMWENRKNLPEAERAVDEVMEVWRGAQDGGRPPSVGVITFNEGQKEAVQDAIDRRLESDPGFRAAHAEAHEGRGTDERLFVKNIENVQGDERDVIIFSVGYAKDREGRFSNLFGSLSKKGGENRLNVAVTRAKEAMAIVCSADLGDIKDTATNDGPRRLKQFLRYAMATGAGDRKGQEEVLSTLNPAMGRDGEDRTDMYDSEFERMVCERLRAGGHKVDTQVGFSGYRIDLAVVDPDDKGRYLLGIECDGAAFHSARSVRERDVMRQKFLEGKGWVMERVWSRNWWRNPDAEVRRLEARIHELSGGEAGLQHGVHRQRTP